MRIYCKYMEAGKQQSLKSLKGRRRILCPYTHCRIALFGQPELDAHISLLHGYSQQPPEVIKQAYKEEIEGEIRKKLIEEFKKEQGDQVVIFIEETIAFYAFRYALGRRTYAVYDVYSFLKEHWNEFTRKTRKKIKLEIMEAIELDRAGMEMDVRLWQEILNLEDHE